MKKVILAWLLFALSLGAHAQFKVPNLSVSGTSTLTGPVSTGSTLDVGGAFTVQGGPVPISAGGTGLTAIGAANQVLTVNSTGTGYIFTTPSGGGGSGGVTIVAKQGAIQSITGTTADTVIDSVTVPANTLGANGALEIESAWSWTNNSNNKTPAIKVNGTSIIGIPVQSTTNTGQWYVRMMNRGVTNQQGTYSSPLFSGSSSTPILVTNFDSTQPLTVTFECTLANAADTCSLENFIIKAFP